MYVYVCVVKYVVKYFVLHVFYVFMLYICVCFQYVILWICMDVHLSSGCLEC